MSITRFSHKHYPLVTVSGEVVRLKPSHKRPSEPSELLIACTTIYQPLLSTEIVKAFYCQYL